MFKRRDHKNDSHNGGETQGWLEGNHESDDSDSEDQSLLSAQADEAKPNDDFTGIFENPWREKGDGNDAEPLLPAVSTRAHFVPPEALEPLSLEANPWGDTAPQAPQRLPAEPDVPDTTAADKAALNGINTIDHHPVATDDGSGSSAAADVAAKGHIFASEGLAVTPQLGVGGGTYGSDEDDVDSNVAWRRFVNETQSSSPPILTAAVKALSDAGDDSRSQTSSDGASVTSSSSTTTSPTSAQKGKWLASLSHVFVRNRPPADNAAASSTGASNPPSVTIRKIFKAVGDGILDPDTFSSSRTRSVGNAWGQLALSHPFISTEDPDVSQARTILANLRDTVNKQTQLLEGLTTLKKNPPAVAQYKSRVQELLKTAANGVEPNRKIQAIDQEIKTCQKVLKRLEAEVAKVEQSIPAGSAMVTAITDTAEPGRIALAHLTNLLKTTAKSNPTHFTADVKRLLAEMVVGVVAPHLHFAGDLNSEAVQWVSDRLRAMATTPAFQLSSEAVLHPGYDSALIARQEKLLTFLQNRVPDGDLLISTSRLSASHKPVQALTDVTAVQMVNTLYRQDLKVSCVSLTAEEARAIDALLFHGVDHNKVRTPNDRVLAALRMAADPVPANKVHDFEASIGHYHDNLAQVLGIDSEKVSDLKQLTRVELCAYVLAKLCLITGANYLASVTHQLFPDLLGEVNENNIQHTLDNPETRRKIAEAILLLVTHTNMGERPNHFAFFESALQTLLPTPAAIQATTDPFLEGDYLLALLQLQQLHKMRGPAVGLNIPDIPPDATEDKRQQAQACFAEQRVFVQTQITTMSDTLRLANALGAATVSTLLGLEKGLTPIKVIVGKKSTDAIPFATFDGFLDVLRGIRHCIDTVENVATIFSKLLKDADKGEQYRQRNILMMRVLQPLVVQILQELGDFDPESRDFRTGLHYVQHLPGRAAPFADVLDQIRLGTDNQSEAAQQALVQGLMRLKAELDKTLTVVQEYAQADTDFMRCFPGLEIVYGRQVVLHTSSKDAAFAAVPTVEALLQWILRLMAVGILHHTAKVLNKKAEDARQEQFVPQLSLVDQARRQAKRDTSANPVSSAALEKDLPAEETPVFAVLTDIKQPFMQYLNALYQQAWQHDPLGDTSSKPEEIVNQVYQAFAKITIGPLSTVEQLRARKTANPSQLLENWQGLTSNLLTNNQSLANFAADRHAAETLKAWAEAFMHAPTGMSALSWVARILQLNEVTMASWIRELSADGEWVLPEASRAIRTQCLNSSLSLFKDDKHNRVSFTLTCLHPKVSQYLQTKEQSPQYRLDFLDTALGREILATLYALAAYGKGADGSDDANLVNHLQQKVKNNEVSPAVALLLAKFDQMHGNVLQRCFQQTQPLVAEPTLPTMMEWLGLYFAVAFATWSRLFQVRLASQLLEAEKEALEPIARMAGLAAGEALRRERAEARAKAAREANPGAIVDIERDLQNPVDDDEAVAAYNSAYQAAYETAYKTWCTAADGEQSDYERARSAANDVVSRQQMAEHNFVCALLLEFLQPTLTVGPDLAATVPEPVVVHRRKQRKAPKITVKNSLIANDRASSSVKAEVLTKVEEWIMTIVNDLNTLRSFYPDMNDTALQAKADLLKAAFKNSTALKAATEAGEVVQAAGSQGPSVRKKSTTSMIELLMAFRDWILRETVGGFYIDHVDPQKRTPESPPHLIMLLSWMQQRFMRKRVQAAAENSRLRAQMLAEYELMSRLFALLFAQPKAGSNEATAPFGTYRLAITFQRYSFSAIHLGNVSEVAHYLSWYLLRFVQECSHHSLSHTKILVGDKKARCYTLTDYLKFTRVNSPLAMQFLKGLDYCVKSEPKSHEASLEGLLGFGILLHWVLSQEAVRGLYAQEEKAMPQYIPPFLLSHRTTVDEQPAQPPHEQPAAAGVFTPVQVLPTPSRAEQAAALLELVSTPGALAQLTGSESLSEGATATDTDGVPPAATNSATGALSAAPITPPAVVSVADPDAPPAAPAANSKTAIVSSAAPVTPPAVVPVAVVPAAATDDADGVLPVATNSATGASSGTSVIPHAVVPAADDAPSPIAAATVPAADSRVTADSVRSVGLGGGTSIATRLQRTLDVPPPPSWFRRHARALKITGTTFSLMCLAFGAGFIPGAATAVLGITVGGVTLGSALGFGSATFAVGSAAFVAGSAATGGFLALGVLTVALLGVGLWYGVQLYRQKHGAATSDRVIEEAGVSEATRLPHYPSAQHSGSQVRFPNTNGLPFDANPTTTPRFKS